MEDLKVVASFLLPLWGIGEAFRKGSQTDLKLPTNISIYPDPDKPVVLIPEKSVTGDSFQDLLVQ